MSYLTAVVGTVVVIVVRPSLCQNQGVDPLSGAVDVVPPSLRATNP